MRDYRIYWDVSKYTFGAFLLLAFLTSMAPPQIVRNLSVSEIGPSLLEHGQKIAEHSQWILRLLGNLAAYATVIVPFFVVRWILCRDDRLKSRFGKDLFGDTIALVGCAVGLLTAYLTWGVLQEKIMTRPYDFSGNPIELVDFETDYKFSAVNPDAETKSHKFSDSQFLVFLNRISAFATAGIYILITMKRQPIHAGALYKYSYASISNILSSWCQYEALKFITFPTQVLGKACKIIPVMLMGKVVGRKSYPWHQYATAALLSMGVSLFLLSRQHKKATLAHSMENSVWADTFSITNLSGIALLIGYLTCDAFTSNWQGALFKQHKMSSVQMMCGVNFFSALLTFVALLEHGVMEKYQKMTPSDYSMNAAMALHTLVFPVNCVKTEMATWRHSAYSYWRVIDESLMDGDEACSSGLNKEDGPLDIQNSMTRLKISPAPPKLVNCKTSAGHSPEKSDAKIQIRQYRDERDLEKIMEMVSKMLSEPYSIFTYRYFIRNWPELCFVAFRANHNDFEFMNNTKVANNSTSNQNECHTEIQENSEQGVAAPLASASKHDALREQICGTVVCKIDDLHCGQKRGYIAMLAVDQDFRRARVGTRLVSRAVEQMEKMQCDEAMLETEITNVGALRLYERLGFIRERRLHRYYLNGVDAYRLKLWFRMPKTDIDSQLQSITDCESDFSPALEHVEYKKMQNLNDDDFVYYLEECQDKREEPE